MPQTQKPTTWTFTNVAIVPNEKAQKPSDTALSITADTIVKNGKPLTGHTLNLTVAHLSDPTFKLSQNDKERTATVIRTEGKKGRKDRTGTDSDTLNAFVNRFRS